ncbi:MAG: hypothetical protein ACLFM7_01015, partial [Bacteroidales bacterium]
LFPIRKDMEALFELNLQVLSDGRRHSLITSDLFSINPRLGAEFNYGRIVYIRLGVGNFQKIQDIDGDQKLNYQPNIGVGLRYKNISLDYSLTDLGDQSIALYSNIFSLKYAFDEQNDKSSQ